MSKIYTKAGDGGYTWCGGQVRKDAAVCEVVGTLDELNAEIGLAIACLSTIYDLDTQTFLGKVQGDLFEIGAEVAFGKVSEAWSGRVAEMEAEIDRMTAEMPPLANFILPGGYGGAPNLHVARAVARRAERLLVGSGCRAAVITYLNRLSDLLFTQARYANDQGKSDIIWEPEAKKC